MATIAEFAFEDVPSSGWSSVAGVRRPWKFGDMLVVGDRYPAVVAMYIGPYIDRSTGPASAASWLWPIAPLPPGVFVPEWNLNLPLVALNSILTLVDE